MYYCYGNGLNNYYYDVIEKECECDFYIMNGLRNDTAYQFVNSPWNMGWLMWWDGDIWTRSWFCVFYFEVCGIRQTLEGKGWNWSVWNKDDPGVIKGCKWEFLNIIICVDYLFGLFI